MYVVCTHPDNGDIAFVDNVPCMLSEVDSLMSLQRDRVREIRSMSAEDCIVNDPPGGGRGDHAFEEDEWAEPAEVDHGAPSSHAIAGCHLDVHTPTQQIDSAYSWLPPWY